MRAALGRTIRTSSLVTLALLVPHYLTFYLLGWPLWTEAIAEWIMAHTPSRLAVAILSTLGPWAKPFAMTGALALLGFAVFLLLLPAQKFIPAPPHASRRKLLTSTVMGLGVAAVAIESYARDQALARRAVEPVALFPFHPPPDTFAPGLVRKAVTPVAEFYGMSKNTVDPAIDPATWRLQITIDGRAARTYRYGDLLRLPRLERYVTLRCVSNTLASDLMGTAQWSGIHLSQLITRGQLPASILEAAFIGADGHGDSLSLDYAFQDEILLALGMNGNTLNRTHGFPIRLLAPRYYGFKQVKWIREIAFLSKPYFGTWPKMGYTKEPAVHIASHIDRVRAGPECLFVGGVSFAGVRGIRAVQVRADRGSWIEAVPEPQLSPYTWTRWTAQLPAYKAKWIEARAMDGQGRWQESVEGPLFPDGVTGPTIRRIG